MNIDNRPSGDGKDKADKEDDKKDTGLQASEEVYQPIFNAL